MESEVRSELALDLRPPTSSAAVKCVAGFLREAAMAGEGRVAKLEEYVRGLEEEHRKIEGFRRELPLCMLILSDVIEGLKEELTKCRGGEVITGGGGRPLLEEFMPMNRKSDDEEGMKQEKDFQDKVNWMSSAQLWSDNYSANTSSTTSNTVVTNNNDASSSNDRGNTRERAEDDRSVRGDENPLTESQYRKAGGAFLTFKGLSSFPASGSRKEEKVTAEVVPPLPDLSLLSPSTKTTRGVSSVTEDQRSGKSGSRGSSRGLPPSAVNAQTSLQLQESLSQQASRKPRRCWSPELHRRFVKALQQLGGSQAATPKQIRELMKVDGLTNDEVKSHLQKYRLHTRRMPTPSAPANQQVVVLGGLWVSPENYPVSKQSTSQSGSPQGPLHLANASRGMSATGGDSCEEEDGKSESYSWKGHLQRANGEEETD